MADRYCECLDGRCGETATTVVKGVHACAEHGKALRRITHRRVCPGCGRNLARRGAVCVTCKRKTRAAA